ncbi:MAG: MurR/RpiR family transcriptional regulator [Thermomicrobiales bacterium]
MDSSAKYRTIDCLTMIEQRLPALRGASRKVAEAIVRDPWAILGMTIYEVAEVANVSLPSVTRFSRAVGYPGFRELVQGIAQSLGRIETKDLDDLSGGVTTEGAIPGFVGTVVRRQIDALQTAARTIDQNVLHEAAVAIARSHRATIIGHGGAYVPALGMAIKLNWAGVPAYASTPDLYSNQMMAVTTDDVVIGISHQGRTKEVIEMLRLARAFGATTISVTTVPSSPLGSVANIQLAVLTPEVARAGTFLIALDALNLLADVLAALVSEEKWNGTPPNRAPVVEWIETHLRVGPLPS